MFAPDDVASLIARADAFDEVGHGYESRTIEQLNAAEADLDELIGSIQEAINALRGSQDGHRNPTGAAPRLLMLGRAETALRKAEICKSYLGFIAHMKLPTGGDEGH